MIPVSRRALLAFAVTGGVPPTTAWSADAAGTTAWSRSRGVAVRLVDAGLFPGESGGVRLLGIAIALDPGFLTYWRSPGEAGIPPTADFAGSTDLARAAVLYPAPSRYDEGGAEAFGYKDHVILPVRVTPADPAKPVAIALGLSFAVCSNICLPASANLALSLTSTGDGSEAAAVKAELSRVPRRVAMGAAGPLAVAGLMRGAKPDSFLVTVRAPSGSQPSLFPEAPDGWYVVAGPATVLPDGRTQFPLDVAGRPSGSTGAPPSTTLTVVTATDAIEVAARLDAAGATP